MMKQYKHDWIGRAVGIELDNEKEINKMKEPINLNAKRAIAKGDSTLWSPLEMLKDLISEIEKGNINPDKMVCHFLEKEDKDLERKYGFCVAGVDYPNHIALLTIALQNVTNGWKT